MCLPAVLASPVGRGGDANIRIEHVYLGDGSFQRLSLANVIPEIDQVATAIGLARWFDPLIDSDKAARIRALTLTLYEAMADDPAFAELGSVLGSSYAEITRSSARWRSLPPRCCRPSRRPRAA